MTLVDTVLGSMGSNAREDDQHPPAEHHGKGQRLESLGRPTFCIGGFSKPVSYQRCSVVDRKLLIDTVQMGFDGTFRKVELTSHLLVRPSLAYHVHDLTFTLGQCSR